MFAPTLASIRSLQRQLAAELASIDARSVTSDEARELVVEGTKLSRLGLSTTTRFAIAAAADRSWERTGHRSPAEQYAADHDTTKSEANDVLTLAGQAADLPELASAIADGALSTAQAKAIGSAGAASPDAVPGLLDLASRSSLGELAQACDRVKADADPDPEATAQRVRKARALKTWVRDGVGHIHISGPPEDTARMMNKLRTTADATFRAKRAAKAEVDPPEAQLYDAALDTVCSDAGGTPTKAGADAKVILRADINAWRRGYPVDGEVCEIAGVGPVPVSVLEAWLPHAFITVVLTEGKDVVNVTHLGRRFTAHQRTALQWRDPQCAAAGCTNTLWLEYDHDTGWAVTHTTEVGDADRLCRRCHRKKTLGWTLHPPDEHGQRHLTPPPQQRPGGPPPTPPPTGGTRSRTGIDPEIAKEFADAVAAVRARNASAA